MDDLMFDRWSQLLASAPNRRTVFGLTIGVVAGGLSRILRQEGAAAGKKGRGKGKGQKKKKQKQPQGERCGTRTCSLIESCCGGRCVDPALCCQSTEDCNNCQACVGGACQANPEQDGAKCADCMLCAGGECRIPEDDFCDDHQICRPENGRCCEKCRGGECCAIGEVCINPGGSEEKSCCNTARGEPCGSNGDGTYRACCESGVEECIQGACELKLPCPGGGFAAQGLCCEGGQAPCWGPNGPFCPPLGHTCCGATSCDGTQRCCDEVKSLCCPKGQCAAGQCCSGELKGCDGQCVDTDTSRDHCGRCGFSCNVAGFECCSGSCTSLQSDEENCGACGNSCDARTQVCREGQCRDICSLNQPPWQNRCDDGVDYWCCPDGSTQCCRLSGNPHCC